LSSLVKKLWITHYIDCNGGTTSKTVHRRNMLQHLQMSAVIYLQKRDALSDDIKWY